MEPEGGTNVKGEKVNSLFLKKKSKMMGTSLHFILSAKPDNKFPGSKLIEAHGHWKKEALPGTLPDPNIEL